ncbi:uncharacterized protein [Melopsittacus undulatus]|uniref:uncharacterized protein n=1 Tax=Melopsittacus undulatus TaxID=13146 RepID=UPI00146C0935|nr:uncharacterized protein LOC117435930 [Melopsittacus undulatus]
MIPAEVRPLTPSTCTPNTSLCMRTETSGPCATHARVDKDEVIAPGNQRLLRCCCCCRRGVGTPGYKRAAPRSGHGTTSCSCRFPRTTSRSPRDFHHHAGDRTIPHTGTLLRPQPLHPHQALERGPWDETDPPLPSAVGCGIRKDQMTNGSENPAGEPERPTGSWAGPGMRRCPLTAAAVRAGGGCHMSESPRRCRWKSPVGLFVVVCFLLPRQGAETERGGKNPKRLGSAPHSAAVTATTATAPARRVRRRKGEPWLGSGLDGCRIQLLPTVPAPLLKQELPTGGGARRRRGEHRLGVRKEGGREGRRRGGFSSGLPPDCEGTRWVLRGRVVRLRACGASCWLGRAPRVCVFSPLTRGGCYCCFSEGPELV